MSIIQGKMWNYIQGVKNHAENVNRKAEKKNTLKIMKEREQEYSLEWTEDRPWLVTFQLF